MTNIQVNITQETKFFYSNVSLTDNSIFLDSRSGKKWLMPIATHELGHSLGLGHSKDRESIMYAYYKSSMPASGLTDDDVKAIQYLYGNLEIHYVGIKIVILRKISYVLIMLFWL